MFDRILKNLANNLAINKQSFGLQDIDLIPGDVNKFLTGSSANSVYGTPVAPGVRDYSTPDNTIPTFSEGDIDDGGFQNYDQNANNRTTGGGGTGDGGTGDGGTNNGSSAFEEAVARARAAYEASIRDADYNLSRARGLFDEGMGVLGQRRQEFQNLFNEGRDRILDRYEGERGNLQAAAQGAQQRAANVLRAMGITGGSAPINFEGRQRQENMKNLGTLQTQRNENETANQSQFDERNLWARTQESALQRSLDDALNARRSLGERAGLVQQGDVDAINREANSFNNILNNVLGGMQGVKGLASNFTANPLSVNIADMSGAIDAITPTMTNTGATGVQNVNLREQDPLFSNLLKRAGGSLYAY